MVMHASFLQDMQSTGLHLPGAPPPPPPPCHNLFATLDEKVRTIIIKNIFLDRYLSSSSAFELTDFDAIAFKDHDGVFDWMKQRLDALDYATKPKGISYWEYDACYDEIKHIFFFSPIMASTVLKVFIELHTRRMSARHLGSKDLPFFFTEKFPINKLQHLSLYIDAESAKSDDAARFHALIEAIPTIHLTFTNLRTLKVEVIWKPKPLNEIRVQQSQNEILVRNHIQKLAVMLCLETKRLAHVGLRSGEQMVFRGEWYYDQQTVARLLAPRYSVPVRVPADSFPVALCWPLGSKFGPKVHYRLSVW